MDGERGGRVRGEEEEERKEEIQGKENGREGEGEVAEEGKGKENGKRERK